MLVQRILTLGALWLLAAVAGTAATDVRSQQVTRSYDLAPLRAALDEATDVRREAALTRGRRAIADSGAAQSEPFHAFVTSVVEAMVAPSSCTVVEGGLNVTGDALKHRAVAKLLEDLRQSLASDTASAPLAAPVDLYEPFRRVRVNREWTAAPLRQVLREIAADAGTALDVDWHELDGAGIKPDEPVTLKLADVSGDKALRAVFDHAGKDLVQLDLMSGQKGPIVTTSSAIHLTAPLVPCVYRVGDFIQSEDLAEQDRVAKWWWQFSPVALWIVPDCWCVRKQQPAVIVLGDLLLIAANEGEQREFAKLFDAMRKVKRGDAVVPVSETIRVYSARDTDAAGLGQRMQNAVDMDRWNVNGGSEATLQVFGGMLFVSATTRMHEAVEVFLK